MVGRLYLLQRTAIGAENVGRRLLFHLSKGSKPSGVVPAEELALENSFGAAPVFQIVVPRLR